MNFVKPDRPQTLEQHDFEHKDPPREEFTLAHLSDPHLSSLKGVRITELLNKRVYGYISWHLRRNVRHHDATMTALLNDIRDTRPDHIAVTGDLTHLALPGEFHVTRKMLESLGPPSKVTVIPGNHDAYVPMAWNRTFCLWSDYMNSDASQDFAEQGKNTVSAFPILRIRSGIALIGVSTARPTPPLLALGSIGKTQLKKLAKILVETRQKGLFRVVMIHHPPFPGTVSWRKRLTDHAAFQVLLARYGAELILHGHAHRPSLGYIDTSWGNIPAIGVQSASGFGRSGRHRAGYHICRFIRNDQKWELFLSVRVYSPTQRRFFGESEQRMQLPQPAGMSRKCYAS